MKVIEFQKLCSSIARKIDKEKSINRDGQFCISQIIEELGELAKEINREKLRGIKANKSDLEDEFADVIFLILDLAEYLDVNVEKAVGKKIEIIKERFPYLKED